MQLTRVDSKNLSVFAPLLPQSADWHQLSDTETIGAVVDDTACAVMVLGRMADSLEIEWLYVAPSYRGSGVGGALLDMAVSEAARVGATLISTCYECPGGEKSLLDLLFLSRRFSLRSSTLKRYSIEQETFFKTGIARLEEMAGSAQLPGCFMSLKDAPAAYFKQRCRKRGLSCEALLRGADMELSSAYIEDRELKGYLIVSAPSPDTFRLESISLEAQSGAVPAGLLLQCAQSMRQRLRSSGRTGGNIEWYSVDGFAQKLTGLLADSAQETLSYMHTAELEL